MPLHLAKTFIIIKVNKVKILIIRAGAIGDTLMLMPLINALSMQHQVTILGRKPGIDYLEPYVGECIDIERGGWHKLFTESTDNALVPQVDYVVAFVSDSGNIVSGNLKKIFPDSSVNVFPTFPDPESKTHVALYMACALESAGLPIDCQQAFASSFASPAMPYESESDKYIILHPGSGSTKKNYHPDFWIDLLDLLRRKCAPGQRELCVLLGPAEEGLVDVFKSKIAHGINMFICPDRKKLLDFLSNTQLYIGHDSGVTHLAAMMGKNTIALFKDSSVEMWRPLGPNVKIIEQDMDTDKVLKKVINEIVMFAG